MRQKIMRQEIMRQEMEISGIPILIERKSIKNMYLRVLPPDGAVKITVPKRVSEDRIRAFVMSKYSWILTNRENIRSRCNQPEVQYQSGETHYLWGRPYQLEVVFSENKAKVWIAGDNMILQVKPDYTLEQRKKLMEEWYRIQLKLAIPPVLDKCVNIVGKSPLEWRVKNMKTKWGTCNITEKRIWLNLQLARKAPECLEYVITHELVHFYCRNHDAQFRAYMDRFYQEWREVKKKL